MMLNNACHLAAASPTFSSCQSASAGVFTFSCLDKVELWVILFSSLSAQPMYVVCMYIYIYVIFIYMHANYVKYCFNTLEYMPCSVLMLPLL